jgi:hypothetical protein
MGGVIVRPPTDDDRVKDALDTFDKYKGRVPQANWGSLLILIGIISLISAGTVISNKWMIYDGHLADLRWQNITPNKISADWTFNADSSIVITHPPCIMNGDWELYRLRARIAVSYYDSVNKQNISLTAPWFDLPIPDVYPPANDAELTWNIAASNIPGAQLVSGYNYSLRTYHMFRHPTLGYRFYFVNSSGQKYE